MNQLKITFPELEQKAENQEQENPRLEPASRLVMRLCKDGRIRAIPLNQKKRNLVQFAISFWARVKKEGQNECWNWTKAKHTQKNFFRYGIVWWNGKKYYAHRAAWIITNGKIPKEMNICHHCDNPMCVNPSHLFLGTQKDNVQDCKNKGRFNKEKGEDRYNATLKESDIIEIRRRYVPRSKENSGVKLAKEFGVGHSMISAIIKKTRWKHVQKPKDTFPNTKDFPY